MASPSRPHDPRITVIQQELFDERRSKADEARDLVVGRPGWGPLLAFEVVMLAASWVPGALGLFLRGRLYPLRSSAASAGTSCSASTSPCAIRTRSPSATTSSSTIVLSLDAKGTDNRGIVIGSGVFVGRNTILSCKNGDIVLDDRANLGFNCEIFSASTVRVGTDVLMAAYTYLVGGDHLYDRVDIPVLQQGRTARGIDVGAGVWLGAHVVVTDGSCVGRDAIIGAGAVVVGDIPEFAIAVGTPAKVIRDRRADGASVSPSPQPPVPSP